MKRYLLLILFIVSSISPVVLAQNSDNNPIHIPNPIRNYPFRNGEVEDVANFKNGTKIGSVEPTSDRFGIANNAIRLAENSYVSTPSFFDGSNIANGYTISFWTKIDEKITKNTGNSPWLPSDKIYHGFFGYSGASNADIDLLGFSRRRDRALIDRYAEAGNNKKNWSVWYWDPINFTEREGWYHIIIVYAKAQVYLYVYDPTTTLQSGVYYFRLQDLTSVTSWGIGGRLNSLKYIDDFKVFDKPLSREQVVELHGQEAVPAGGMYRISPVYDDDKSIGTIGQSRVGNTKVELYNKFTPNTSTYQWVFEPVAGKENVYMIKMAYEDDMYLHLTNSEIKNGVRIEISPKANFNPTMFEWLVEPERRSTGGYGSSFTIQNALFPSYGIRPVNSTTVLGAPLELYEGPLFHWKLSLIKTSEQINNVLPFLNSQYGTNIRSTENTFFNLMNLDPLYLSTTVSRIGLSRVPFQLWGSIWHITKTLDGSYYLRGSESLFLHPEGNREEVGTPLEIYQQPNNNRQRVTTRWDITQASPFSNNYVIRSVFNNTLGIGADIPEKNGQVMKLKVIQPDIKKEDKWSISPSRPGFNEIYYIKPGVYKIALAVDPNNAFIKATSSQSGTPLVVNQFDNLKSTFYYWQIDYEYNTYGDPVRDGTYMIKLLGTSGNFMHTVQSSLTEYTKVEASAVSQPEQIGTYKWFIKPSEDNSGYYIQPAGDKSMYLHIYANNTSNTTTLDISKYYVTSANASKWSFTEPEEIKPPLQDGNYVIYQRSRQSSLFVVPENWSNNDGTPLITSSGLSERPDAEYQWYLEKQPDSTYLIKRTVDEKKYIHPKGGSTADKTDLELYRFDTKENPRVYKWIIVKNEDGSYLLKNVEDPDRWMRAKDGTIGNRKKVEIYRFRDHEQTSRSYEWIIAPR